MEPNIYSEKQASDLGIRETDPIDYFQTSYELYLEYLYDDLVEEGVF